MRSRSGVGRVAVVVWLVCALSACVSPTEPATRADQLYVNVTTQGTWAIELPLPANGVDIATWREHLRVSEGQATLHWQDGARPLRVEGEGTVWLEALWRDADVECLACAMEPEWSSGQAAELPILVEGHVELLHVEHVVVTCEGDGCAGGEGAQRPCNLRVNGFLQDATAGLHVMAPHVTRSC